MHTDVEALWPIIAGNQIQGIISLDVLHGFCVATALMALLVWPIARRYSGASQ
jgi:hypothetical protein